MLSRRSFVRRVGVATGGAIAGAHLPGIATPEVPVPPIPEGEILANWIHPPNDGFWLLDRIAQRTAIVENNAFIRGVGATEAG